MTAPIAVAETYISCVTLPVVLGGVTLACIDGGFVPGRDADDMTNSAGAGFYEDVPTIAKATGTLTLAYKGVGAPLGFVSGSVYAMTINLSGNPTFSGNVRVMLDGGAVVDVKSGVKIKMSFTSQGAFTYAI